MAGCWRPSAPLVCWYFYTKSRPRSASFAAGERRLKGLHRPGRLRRFRDHLIARIQIAQAVEAIEAADHSRHQGACDVSVAAVSPGPALADDAPRTNIQLKGCRAAWCCLSPPCADKSRPQGAFSGLCVTRYVLKMRVCSRWRRHAIEVAVVGRLKARKGSCSPPPFDDDAAECGIGEELGMLLPYRARPPRRWWWRCRAEDGDRADGRGRVYIVAGAESVGAGIGAVAQDLGGGNAAEEDSAA